MQSNVFFSNKVYYKCLLEDFEFSINDLKWNKNKGTFLQHDGNLLYLLFLL